MANTRNANEARLDPKTGLYENDDIWERLRHETLTPSEWAEIDARRETYLDMLEAEADTPRSWARREAELYDND